MNKKLVIIMGVLIIFMISCTIVNAETRNNNPLLHEILIDGKEMEPKFDQFVDEYVIVTEKDRVDLEIELEDPNASYEIIGNTNLKEGKNKIEIKVTAEDKTTTKIYILYVTKTKNIEKSNANLKELKVNGYTLNPKFNEKDIKYYIQYENEVDKFEINAVAQNKNSKVKISGNENFQFGKTQIIDIEVIAEDGFTKKNYQIIANKMDKENFDNEENYNFEQDNNKEFKDKDRKKIKKDVIIITVGAILVFLIFILIVLKNKRKN